MVDTSALQALLSGYNGQANPTTPAAPVAQPEASNPLAKLQALFNGGTDLGSFIQKAGMGMANMGPTGGDPYLAFAQGFGGTAKYTTEQQAAAAAAKQKEIENAMAANKLAMDQGQFDSRMSQDQSQFDARQSQSQTNEDRDYALRQAADKRAEMIAAQQVKKTQAEIEKMARSSGITVDQQLQIERIAQAEAENIIDPSERKKTVDAARERLTQQIQQDKSLSTGPGVSDADQTPITATGPDGKTKLILKDGQWVPLQ